jgi:hypothetical protein
MSDAIHLSASNKAFSKIATLEMELLHLKQDIKRNHTGGVSLEELHLVESSTKKELTI